MAPTKSRGAANLKLMGPDAAEQAAPPRPRARQVANTSVSEDPDLQETNQPLEALVDGKRVVIDACDEIVLRCGKASITLRRNGRVIIRGTYVETRAEGVNRVKGGSVQIN